MAKEPPSFVPENLRFLLWQQKTKREKWVVLLAEHLRCSEDRAWKLLHSGRSTAPELDRAADYFEISQEELMFSRLIERKNLKVFDENLRFLLSELPKGQKGELAKAVGVHATTVSRWAAGINTPERDHLKKILSYFGLKPDTDLEKEPLFLSMDPVSDRSRREWLQRQIEKIDSNELSDLFPALKKLMEG
jgi:transcriptional regulator with XRE-family HTH domain